ncbi:MAG: hypothetical protein OEV41_02390 [Gammaproteobacteria bacterium]|nr:hypothetical protein [Gammaproteobacteria bacterium]
MNALREGFVADDHVTPDFADQVVLADRVRRVMNEHSQELRRERRESDGPLSPADRPAIQIDEQIQDAESSR